LVRSIISISFDEDALKLVKQAEEICKKEGKKFNLSAILRDVIKQHLIKFVTGHGDGNPHSTMDQFFNEGFIVTPALARATNSEDIKKYLLEIKSTPQFAQIGDFLTTWATLYNAVEENKIL